MHNTFKISIEQEALAPWAGKLDIYDAALIDHVCRRVGYRARQKMLLHEGLPVAWVHLPTIRAENWLLPFSDQILGKRLARITRLGLLIRKVERVTNRLGERKGTRTYYGPSETYRKILDAMEQGRKSRKPRVTDRSPATGHSEAPTDQSPATGHSLRVLRKTRVESRDCDTSPAARVAMQQPSESPPEDQEAQKGRPSHVSCLEEQPMPRAMATAKLEALARRFYAASAPPHDAGPPPLGAGCSSGLPNHAPAER